MSWLGANLANGCRWEVNGLHCHKRKATDTGMAISSAFSSSLMGLWHLVTSIIETLPSTVDLEIAHWSSICSHMGLAEFSLTRRSKLWSRRRWATACGSCWWVMTCWRPAVKIKWPQLEPPLKTWRSHMAMEHIPHIPHDCHHLSLI